MDATMTSLPENMTQDQWDAICEAMQDERWDDDRTEEPEGTVGMTQEQWDALNEEEQDALIATLGGEYMWDKIMDDEDERLMDANPNPALRCTEDEFKALVADDAAVCLTCGHVYFAWDDPDADYSRPCEECEGHVYMIKMARLMGQVVFSGKNNSDLRGC